MVYIIVAAAIIPLVIGLLLGAMRGSRRALLRLILVILCLVAAFCLKGVATDWAMQFEVEGQPLDQYILSQLGDYAAMGEVIMPVIQLIVMAVVFLALFFGIKLISWIIIFPICKIFVKKARKKKDGSYGNKHALIGGVIGLVQGAAVAVVLCVILNGLFFNVANVMAAVNDEQNDSPSESAYVMVIYADSEEHDASVGEGGGGSEGSEGPLASVDVMKMLIEYKDSGVCKMINGTGGDKIFDAVISIKNEDGQKLTLTGQLNALTGIIRMGKELAALGDMNMTGGLSGDVATNITAIFDKLGEICDNLSDESKQTMNNIVQIVADNFLPDAGIDITVINFETVDFRNEGQVIAKLNEYKDLKGEDLTTEQATKIVETVMQSDIILPLLSSNDEFTIGLNEEQQQYAKNIIDDLAAKPETDQDKIEMLRKFFGLNDNANQGGIGGNVEIGGGVTVTPEQPEQPENPEQPLEPKAA